MHQKRDMQLPERDGFLTAFGQHVYKISCPTERRLDTKRRYIFSKETWRPTVYRALPGSILRRRGVPWSREASLKAKNLAWHNQRPHLPNINLSNCKSLQWTTTFSHWLPKEHFSSTNHACVLSCFSHVQLFATPWTLAHQAPLSMGFSKQEYWSGLPCPPLGDLSDPRIKPMSLVFPALAGKLFTTSTTWEAQKKE